MKCTATKRQLKAQAAQGIGTHIPCVHKGMHVYSSLFRRSVSSRRVCSCFLTEAQRKGRKGTAERRAGWWYKFTHSSLLVLASCLRNDIVCMPVKHHPLRKTYVNYNVQLLICSNSYMSDSRQHMVGDKSCLFP